MAGLQGDVLVREQAVVEGYNRDDCVSLRALRDWLEVQRTRLEAESGRAVPRPGPPKLDEDAEREEDQREVRALMERLLDGVPEEREARSDLQHIRWLAAHLLEWHRREDKSAWWDYYRLRELSLPELIEESKPLAGLEYEGIVRTEKQSNIYRFRFPPQTHRVEVGDNAIDLLHPDGKRTIRKVSALDELNGVLDLKVGQRTKFEPVQLKAVIPDEIVPTKGQRARLRETADRLLAGSDALTAWSPASAALLLRTAPELRGGAALEEPGAGERLVDHCRDVALAMGRGVLPVQGPPGTGKTYSGARMIRALLRAGFRVGITGPSHKVITNLVDACALRTWTIRRDHRRAAGLEGRAHRFASLRGGRWDQGGQGRPRSARDRRPAPTQPDRRYGVVVAVGRLGAIGGRAVHR